MAVKKQLIMNTEIVVLGAGPGGYAAAFRAADLDKKVVLVERFESLGGVCLNVGCIPSKALLHAVKILDEARQMGAHGIEFGTLHMDVNGLRAWKESVVKKLNFGLKSLSKQRKVEIVTGKAQFSSAHSLTINDAENTTIEFENAIIAAGSHPVQLPFLPQDPRIIDSTDALNLNHVPQEMLIIGGGIIGLEMATVYRTLGSKITIVELMDQLIPGLDADIVKPLHQYITKQYDRILLKTKVIKAAAREDGIYVTFEGIVNEEKRFDCVLVAVGREPNGKLIGAENAGIIVDERGFIPVDKQLRTNVKNIFAIGDIVGNPMLAHKASYQGKLAAQIIATGKGEYNNPCIPSVAYTDPEIAWVGYTENELIKQNIPYKKGVFPWMANGRSLSLGRSEGLTKLLFDPNTQQILGGSIVGPNAGELIAEIALAIHMKATAHDIAETIHPHPTLSETTMMAAEVFEGTVTDIFLRN